MKINIKIWAGVILLSALVIAFRNFEFPSTKKFLIERKFGDTNIKQVRDPFVEGLDITTMYSDSLISSYQLASLNDSINNCRVRYYDINSFSPLDSFEFQIPKTAQLKYCSRNRVFLIDKFQLQSYDPASKQFDQLTAGNLKCLNVTQINSNTLLLFAEQNEGSKFVTGYFALELPGKTISLSRSLEENPTTFAPNNSLIYSGKFKRFNPDRTIYYCDKYSKVFFFDNDGKFVKEFSTSDQTPKPELVSNSYAFYYKRGSTFNVNHSIHVENGKLLAFSCRSEPVKYLIIDVYDSETGQYLSSTKFHYKDWNCPDIISVNKAGKNTIINFQEGVALFDLSSVGL